MDGCPSIDRRWRDRVRRDLRKFHIDENTWFKECQERAVWRRKCRDGLRETTKERLAEGEVRRSVKRNAAATTGQRLLQIPSGPSHVIPVRGPSGRDRTLHVIGV